MPSHPKGDMNKLVESTGQDHRQFPRVDKADRSYRTNAIVNQI